MQFRKPNRLMILISLFLITSIYGNQVMAQSKNQMVRLAKITIDPLQLEKYNQALKEQMATAIRLEPGVLTYYAMADKTDPSHITILEIYADTTAYQDHILTSHFKKYKDSVRDMVKSLELVDVNLIAAAKQPGL